jgi:K(+)-stimulated pyrophosphate-energized sodium pump
VAGTTAAAGRALAAGSAALAGLALSWAYAAAAGVHRIDLAGPATVVGMLLGGGLPVFVAGRVLAAVGGTAAVAADEAGRQLREIGGLREGTAEPDCDRCVDLPARRALRAAALPGGVALAVPVLAGVLLGTQALGGLLAGTLLVGTLLAFVLAEAGDALDSPEGIPGVSAPDGAATLARAVGEPLRSAAGPAMNILVKLVAATALVIAPWLLRLHGTL